MTTDQDKTVAALQDAIKMEIDGKEFYLKASLASNNDLGKKLLQSLAAEEDIHRQVFEKIFNSIRGNKGWPKTDFKPDGGHGLRTVFAKAMEGKSSEIKTLPTELDAVQTAMAMENKTYDFYIKRGKTATFEAEKEFYNALAGQESQHHKVLRDYYEYLQNPAAYFVQKEHPSLDGG